MDLLNLKTASTIKIGLKHPVTNTSINKLIAGGFCVPNESIELSEASDGVRYLESSGRMLSYNDGHLYVSDSDEDESKTVFSTNSNDELKLRGGILFGSDFSGFSVTCHAPSSIKYKSAVMQVAKKYADADGKKFLDMDNAEIEQAINKSVATIVDTVIAVTTDCELVFDGEKLTLEQFKALIAKEEYFWIAEQVKGELDAGKLVIQS